jgi:hypothetical protein
MASVTTRLIPGKKRAPQLLADSAPMRCALSRLGQSMLSSATAPRLEFRQSLRRELVAQAAIQARVLRPPQRPPKARKPKGGFRLAALGIGLSAAGGGFALAANRMTTPEFPVAPAPHSAAPGVHQPALGGVSTTPLTGTGLPEDSASHAGVSGVNRGTPGSAGAAPTTLLPTVPKLAQISAPAVNPSAPGATISGVAATVGGALSPAVTNPFPEFSFGGSPPVNPLLPLKESPNNTSASWPDLLPRQLR